jgi:hypothetical protein
MKKDSYGVIFFTFTQSLQKKTRNSWSNALTLQPPSICFQSWTIDKVYGNEMGNHQTFCGQVHGKL